MTDAGGGGGGIIIGDVDSGIIDNSVVPVLSDPKVQAMIPWPLVRNAVRDCMARPCSTWSDDDRWFIGQAFAWLICNC